MVGAILAMVRCSEFAEDVEEFLEREGLELRDDLDELLLISKTSSSESLSGGGKSASLTAIHCSTNVLNEMCFFCVGSLSPGEVTGTAALGDTLPEMGIRGGDRYLTAEVRELAILVSDLVCINAGRLIPTPSSEETSSSSLDASRMGEEGFGMVSISERVRCLRIGLDGARFGFGLSIPRRSSVEDTFNGRTGSTFAVCKGPYNQVTSESFNLG